MNIILRLSGWRCVGMRRAATRSSIMSKIIWMMIRELAGYKGGGCRHVRGGSANSVENNSFCLRIL
jgi:hypothetical protein